MKEIVLLSCVSQKKNNKDKAKHLYISTLFVKSLKYAETKINPDKIFILSAKHGLLEADQEIEPYDETLNDKNKSERMEWSAKVLQQIKSKCDIQADKFYILAGKKYYENLIKKLPNCEIVMENLPIGKRLQWLTEALSK